MCRDRLGGLIHDIQHVGSTSVPGLAAKPVIDIDLVGDRDHFPEIIALLQELGYEHRGNLGISDREAFRRASDSVPFSEIRSHWPAHHLYLCPETSISLRNHLTFRDALRGDEWLRAEYGALKRRLAAAFPFDMDRYVEGKTAFIVGVLQDAGFEHDTLKRIVGENAIR